MRKRESIQILLKSIPGEKKETDGLGFFFSVSEIFLVNWKFKDNKNIVQEETFSIFGDPKPGSKGFISVLKNKKSVHVCTCYAM